MSLNNDDVLEVLKEIRDTLSRIYTCFEDQYLEIQRQKVGDKLEVLEDMLTPIRRNIYPLLFDSRKLSQVEIANRVGATQPTVSRFVSALLEQDLVEQIEDGEGNVTYCDKYDLVQLLRH